MEDTSFLPFLLLPAFPFFVIAGGWFVTAATAGIIASHRGASGLTHFFMALFIGPFAIILAGFSGGKACDYCCMSIPAKAVKCPKCQSDLSEPGD